MKEKWEMCSSYAIMCALHCSEIICIFILTAPKSMISATNFRYLIISAVLNNANASEQKILSIIQSLQPIIPRLAIKKCQTWYRRLISNERY